MVDDDRQWREVVAMSVVIGELEPAVIARLGGVSAGAVAAALNRAAAEGLMTESGVAAEAAVLLMAEFGPAWAAEFHSNIARRLLVHGWDQVADVVHHAREAGSLGPIPELVDLLDHTAKTALSTSDYEPARAFFEVADEFSNADELPQRAWRLCRLAEAFDGLGRVEQARRAAARAFDLAEIIGDADLALEAAVLSAFPADWYAGDLRTTAIIQRAGALQPGEEARVALLASRALAEMRIPVHVHGQQQVAWVTRAAVAQAFADEALERSGSCDAWERLIALLAWRNCHRAPRFLEQRRRLSVEALDLSQKLRLPARQVEAAIMLGGDAIESADRALFDHALSVAKWVAERDSNPRLLSHSRAMAAGAAYATGDIESAQRLHQEAVDFAARVDLSSRLSLDSVLQAEHFVVTGGLPSIEILPRDDHPILAHPFARVVTSVGWARHDDHVQAELLVRQGLLHLDEEASMLLMLVVASETAIRIRSDELMDRITALLRPWAEHVAVDGNTWWHGGPVTAALAELAAARGDHDEAMRYVDEAELTAFSMGDVHTSRRMQHVRDRLGLDNDQLVGATGADANSRLAHLSTRQRRVLELVAAGKSNPEIARELSFSVSTVKAEVAAIFRTLGLSNRAQAARFASEHHVAPLASQTD